MPRFIELKKIAFLGDYLPRKCGIATFTHHLRDAVATHFPNVECLVAAVSDGERRAYDYPPEVVFELSEQNLRDYRQAAEFLRFHNVETISVQHEFGIYGGTEGGHVLTFLREVEIPVVTTLHTILTEPDANQRLVFEELIHLSERLVTMSRRGREILREVYAVPDSKIAVIPHGIPDMPFVDPTFYKDQFGAEGKKVLLTFGLLSPGKGLEYAIEAMPRIVREHPDVIYVILGATHPNLLRQEGEAYRFKLQQLARTLGVQGHVLFLNRFVNSEELKKFIGACDIYLTPYLNPVQITSGTLAYTFGCGKAVVSTPYLHAAELLANDRGVLVPFRDADAIAEAVVDLLGDDRKRNMMRKNAYLEGRSMTWSRAAQAYADVFREARIEAGSRRTMGALSRMPGSEEANRLPELPEIKLDHLRRMTDSTGLFQHAIFSFPNFSEGYSTDDNARGLILTAMLEDLRAGASDVVASLSRTYASFVHHAFNPANGRFRNFMSFDRRWLEEAGSEDCQARVLWSLGCCIARSQDAGLQNWAAQLFERALPMILETKSPRAWAFALIGVHEYHRRLAGVRPVAEAQVELAHRLLNLYRAQSTETWPWFEPVLSYANAKLPHALIVSGRSLGNPEMLELGLETLRWLTTHQTDSKGYFAPIGSNGFFRHGETRAHFDQQPIEAHASVSACLEAHLATHEISWFDEALRAFQWFLGMNKLGASLYDASTGGCRDGLHVDRTNQNQGAESTLAFLLSLVEFKTQEHALRAFRMPLEKDQTTTSQLG